MARVKQSEVRHRPPMGEPLGPGGRRIVGTGLVRKTKAMTSTGVKTTKRYRPGTRALRDIRKLQASTKLVLPRAPFVRLVREVAQDVRHDFRFTKECIAFIVTTPRLSIQTRFGWALDRDGWAFGWE